MPKKAKRTRKRLPAKIKPRLWIYLLLLALCAGVVWFIVTKDEPSKPVNEAINSTFDFQKTLDRIVNKLGVSEGSVSLGTEKSVTVAGIPIDKTRMDLTFANMIIKGEFHKDNVEMVSGRAESGNQLLTFQAPVQKYRIELYYDSAPYAEKHSQKLLAIVVDDFGSLGGELLSDFLDLPPEITFAIFPGMKNSVFTMQQADKQGRQTLIHVPMEPLDYPMVNPGENPILLKMDEGEVARILNKCINAMPLCVGINNHMGGLATTDPDLMGYVMKALSKKGSIFLDSRTSNVSVGYRTAQRAHIPAYCNDLFLDSPDISFLTMDRKIEGIINLSLSRNNIIAITHCHSKEKLEYLKTFIDRINEAGFTLVPLTRVGKLDVPQIL